MRIALTGVGIVGAAVLIDWAEGPGGAVRFMFFSVWALLMVSHAVAAGSRSTPEDASVEELPETPPVRQLPR